MRRLRLSAALLVGLLVAVLTITRAADRISGFEAGTPSAKAKAWLRRVATDLKLKDGKVWTATFEWRSGKPSYAKRKGLKVRAWQLRLKGLDARRLWFETPDEALAYAGQVTASRAKQYVVVEVRGKQVVIASRATTPQWIADAARAIAALWREAPAPQPCALLTVRYGKDAIAGWTLNRGPFHQRIAAAFKRAKGPPSGGVTPKWTTKTSVELIGKDRSTYLTLDQGSALYIHAEGPKHRHRSFRVDEFLQGLQAYKKAGRDRLPVLRKTVQHKTLIFRKTYWKTGATRRPVRRPRRVR